MTLTYHHTHISTSSHSLSYNLTTYSHYDYHASPTPLYISHSPQLSCNTEWQWCLHHLYVSHSLVSFSTGVHSDSSTLYTLTDVSQSTQSDQASSTPHLLDTGTPTPTESQSTTPTQTQTGRCHFPSLTLILSKPTRINTDTSRVQTAYTHTHTHIHSQSFSHTNHNTNTPTHTHK